MDNKKEMNEQKWFFTPVIINGEKVKVQDQMFQEAKKNGHSFFVARDNANSKTKQYTSFLGSGYFLEYEKTLPDSEKNLYEICAGSVAEIYDIDGTYEMVEFLDEDGERRTYDDIIEDFIDARMDFQTENYPDIPLSRSHFRIKQTDDTSEDKETPKEKISFHILIRNGYQFSNMEELGKFVKTFLKYAKKAYPKITGKINSKTPKGIIDTSIYSKNRCIRMLGHSKAISQERKSFRYPNFSTTNDTCDFSDFLASCVPHPCSGDAVFYPIILDKKEKKEKQKEIEQAKGDGVQEEFDENAVDMEELKNWVDIISDSRMDTRDTWLLVCWCLRGLTNKSPEGLELFKYKSSMSTKHDEESCDTEWYRDTGREDTLGIGSLILWAKEDNYEAYQNLVKTCKSTQNNINHCLNGSHCDLAKLFMRVYGDANIKIRSDENISYFGWNETTKLWEECSKHRLLNLISDVLVPYFLTLQKDIYAQIEALGKNDKDKEVTLKIRNKQVCKIVNNLKAIPFLKNISQAVAGKEFDKEFESKIINKSIYELPLKGGKIIDLKTLTVRDRTRNDYFSVELNVSYLSPKEVNFETHVLKFFKSITCDDPKLLDYHRRLWGYMMTGSIADRSLHIMWGNGCNGKSSIVNIFKKIMGDFAVSLDDDTMMKKSSGGAKPEMMDLLHSRCGFLPESEKKETINSKRVKTITGDDEISARHLYGSIIKFRTQCKPIFPTNHKPEIDIDDQAILDRLKLIPFLGRFTKNKKNSEYIKDLQETKLDEFFTWFCGGAFDWINGQELIPCESMNDEMDTYIKENNPIIDFLAETFDLISLEDYENIPTSEKKEWRCKTTDIFMEYGNWRQINGEKALGKVEFYKLLEKRGVVQKKDAKGTKCYLCRLKQEELPLRMLSNEGRSLGPPL